MRKVIIYTASTCPSCMEVKEYFKKKKIPFLERNVQQSKKAKDELLEMGYRTVPIILIDDEEIVGFDKKKLNSIVK